MSIIFQLNMRFCLNNAVDSLIGLTNRLGAQVSSINLFISHICVDHSLVKHNPMELRGFCAISNEVSLLMNNFEPTALCLQELLSDTYAFNNRYYNLLANLPPTTSNNRPHGGAGILVRKTLPHSVIPLNTTLQAVACRISTPEPITLCSMYLPPPSAWTHAGLISTISQLPSPVLLLRDLTYYDSLWGCTTFDKKSQEVVNFLLKTSLCFMNSEAATYVHPATSSCRSIDLAICDPALRLDFSWQVHDVLCGSDHLLIIYCSILCG